MNLNSDLIDLWTKSYSKRIFKYSRVYLFKTKKLARKLQNHDWRKEIHNAEDTYFLNYALRFDAPHNIPLSTLVLLGKCLSDEKLKRKTKNIIQENMIMSEGFAYQLDDIENQSKIRKALRTKKFELPANIQAA